MREDTAIHPDIEIEQPSEKELGPSLPETQKVEQTALFEITTEELAALLGVSIPERNLEQETKTSEQTFADYVSSFTGRPWFSASNIEVQDQRGKDISRKFFEEIAPKEKLIAKGRRALSRARAVREIAQRFFQKKHSVPRNAAHEFISHLESTGTPLIFDMNIQSDSWDRSINTYDNLRKPEFLLLISHLNDPLASFTKAEALFGLEWQSNLAYISVYPQLAEIMLSLDDIPHSVIAQVHQRIAELGFIVVKSEADTQGAIGITKDLQYVVDVCRRGGFNERELSLLDQADQMHTLFPGEFTDFSISLYMENSDYLTKMLKVAKWLIRRRSNNHRMDRYNLLSYCKRIITSETPVTVDLLDSLDEASVTVSLEDIKYQLGISFPITENPTVSQPEESQNAYASSFKVLNNSQIYSLTRDEAVAYYTALAQKQKEIIKDPLWPQAVLLAQHDGMPITTENMFYYSEVAHLIQACAEKIKRASNSEKSEILQDPTLINFLKIVELEEYERFIAKYFSSVEDRSLSNHQLKQLNIAFIKTLRKLLLPAESSEDLLFDIYAARSFPINPLFLEVVSNELRAICELLLTLPQDAKNAVLTNQEEMATFLVDGQETHALMSYLAEAIDRRSFIEALNKNRLALMYGSEKAEQFLAALPQKNDERRNAFTHNQYDRTTELLHHLYTEINFSDLSSIDILTAYIKAFGLARSTGLYALFKQIGQFEKGEATELPQSAEESNVRTIEQLLKEVKSLKVLIMSEDPLTAEKLQRLSPLQMELLKVITGKTTHRFDNGRPSFERIVSDYMQAEQLGEIDSVPEGYKTEKFLLRNVSISFNAEPVREDFELLKTEIVESIDQADEVTDLVEKLLEVVTRKIHETENSLSTLQDKGKDFAQKNLDRLRSIKDAVSTKEMGLDELLVLLLDSNLGKSEQSIENSLKRRIILRKVFQRHFSPAFIEDLKISLSREVSPQGILSVINLLDEMVKQHALNLTSGDGAAQYWSAKTLDILKTAKAGKKLFDIFAGSRDKLKKAVDDFVFLEQGSSTAITAIPNRDFTAEVSGYIADVCYTAEYPLLRDRPVVPYKFVVEGDDNSMGELGGSVLIFEVVDQTGEECLLVRGFDFVNENSINISQFIEDFLDKMKYVAKTRNKTKILLPGNTGALSNYPLTINHVIKNYFLPDKMVGLKDTFNFNGYDLTNNCYVVRTVT